MSCRARTKALERDLTEELRVQSEPRVLLANVDGPLRVLLEGTLAQDGCAVTHARGDNELSCGTLAGLRRTLQTSAPDLVVCDLRAPGRSALDLLRRLRRLDWGIPIVVITQSDDQVAAAEATRLAACAIFKAPFDLDDLRTVVRNFAWVR